MRLRIKVSGLDDYARELRDLGRRIDKPTQLAKLIAQRLRACFAENFNAEGRPEKWAPLSPSTLADKQRLYDQGLIRGRRRGVRVRLGPNGEQRGALPGILMRTGQLKDSVARLHAKGNIERISSNGAEIEVGTALPYADVHDKGGEGAYTIRPKPGKFLSWFGVDRRTGQPGVIFSRGPITHPPLPRRSFLVVTDDTWDQMLADVQNYLNDSVEG